MSLSVRLDTLLARTQRHAAAILFAALALAALAGAYAVFHLALSSDTNRLFADTLPWRQRQIALDHAFPQSTDLLVMVVDAKLPEEAEATAAALASALARDTAQLRDVRRPDASPYFAREGLLFLDKKDLGSLLDRVIDAQPFLGQLAPDPTARGLFGALSLLGIGVQRGEADLAPYASSLKAFADSLESAASGHPPPLSWQRLIGGNLADLGGSYRFVLAQPVLDYGALEPGRAASEAVRRVAAGLEFVRTGEARVRITGSVALADEEFATVAQGMVVGMLGSVALITLWLFLAVRSWRLIVPILLTLAAGFSVTAGFAAVAVGTLNLISVAFAILFVGIAVDFAIQFSVRFREMRLGLIDPSDAMAATIRRVGPQILVAATATAAGFYAFVPTDFRGVAELGLIAGSGMIIAFACTLTILPAALTVFHPPAERTEVALPGGMEADAALGRARLPVLAAILLAALAGALALPHLQFDGDPLHTKNADTEAMRTLHDLIDNPLTNPYGIDILVPSFKDAEALVPRLKALAPVGQVLTEASFVPEDQTAKLALIADAAAILAPTLAAPPSAVPITAADIRQAIRATLAQLDPAVAKGPQGAPLAPLAAALHRLEGAPDATLMAMNAALTRFLPAELDGLRTALSARPVTLADLPPEIRRDWVTAQGQVRIQVLGNAANRNSAGLSRLVGAVRGVAPEAGGAAVSIVDTSATILHAFRSATIGALVAIAAILLLALRRVVDAALVLASLLVSALLVALAAVLLPLPLNFANIIALPLLLGVGVSFNIYFVMNWRAGARLFLGSATARAVLFSALTTGSAFGALALSGHPGTASMGRLLLLSLFCTLIGTFAFLPALLGWLRPATRR